MLKKIKIYSDGGARGNPGPAGIGAVLTTAELEKQFKNLGEYKKYIGETTNNQAEYQAIHLGLEKAKELGAEEVECFLDSELVVKQLNREYKVKDAGLAKWFVRIWNLKQCFKKVSFTHIPREKNKEADKLANEAMDENKKSFSLND